MAQCVSASPHGCRGRRGQMSSQLQMLPAASRPFSPSLDCPLSPPIYSPLPHWCLQLMARVFHLTFSHHSHTIPGTSAPWRRPMRPPNRSLPPSISWSSPVLRLRIPRVISHPCSCPTHALHRVRMSGCIPVPLAPTVTLLIHPPPERVRGCCY